LQLHLASEHYVRDARFRMIHSFPSELLILQWCAAWASGQILGD
jgi:hypothetical protein